VKVFATFVLVLAGLVPTHADTTTQTWAFNEICQGNCNTPANINAIATTQMEQGLFFEAETGDIFSGTEPVVTGISGTFDGLAMSLGIVDPLGFLPWINNSAPEGIPFTAGSQAYVLTWDGDFKLFLPDGSFEILTDPPAAVPEPSTLFLLTALLLLALMRWAQMSLRKLSAH
jgi:hypothetical protein